MTRTDEVRAKVRKLSKKELRIKLETAIILLDSLKLTPPNKLIKELYLF